MTSITKTVAIAVGAGIATGLAVYAYLRGRDEGEREEREGSVKPFKYSQKELAAFNKMFKGLDRDHNGKLDRHEVRLLAKMLYEPTEAEVAACVAKFDTDQDQKISFEEFVQRLTRVQPSGSLEAKTPKAEHKASEIAVDEASRKKLKAQFDALDTNKDGFIDRNEAVALAKESYVPTSATIDVLMAELDKDKNDFVSLDEFCRAMKRAQLGLYKLR